METGLEVMLQNCVEHLNKRRLTFDIGNFLLNKTIYNLFNIHSKKTKKEFLKKMKLLEQKKKQCDICNDDIDKFHPSLVYEIDVQKRTIRFTKIEACCSKCHSIKTFTLFQNTIYKNMESGGLINFAPVYEHYYTVNKMEKEKELCLQNDINIYFTCAILLKNINWIYTTPHKTLNDFLAYTLGEKKKETENDREKGKEKKERKRKNTNIKTKLEIEQDMKEDKNEYNYEHRKQKKNKEVNKREIKKTMAKNKLKALNTNNRNKQKQTENIAIFKKVKKKGKKRHTKENDSNRKKVKKTIAKKIKCRAK